MMTALRQWAVSYDARTPWIGAGRTLIALGQLSILLFASPSALLVPVVGRPEPPYCDGVRSISLYCRGDVGPETWHWLFIGVLLVVASGFAPRWTAIPHAWVAFSLNQSIALPDGGESVAQVVTLLLVPICLLDDRTWHWFRPTRALRPVSRGITLSASLMIRLQMAAIYINSGVAKLGTSAWVEGSAEYYIVRDKNFGASGPVEPVILWITASPLGTAALTWGTIALECLLAILILGTSRMRMLALALGLLLHAAIIVTIGLWSFSFTMIGSLVLAVGIGTWTVSSETMPRWLRSRRTLAAVSE
ncbi:sporulation-delaying protein SdpB family protein [Rathayibacter sp. VKM Ac-2801]|uniref:sporulation-delaying protein SdpB family protein n=1 Tax=Rathayibacter sp. VKM Ac-2801 TaxID=2609255 RepID=UPI0013202AC4|nr:sporulation-delaying protein SdpB family protein [Rathayibacter sp. VKM Ac-2801]QHC70946.1 hypothetical protein GSU45_11580 [Rathayibacter sp. VKM Ac-2801]